MVRITKAQRLFLERLNSAPEGIKHWPSGKTWTFIARMKDAGLLRIHDPGCWWPVNITNATYHITPAGIAALTQKETTK